MITFEIKTFPLQVLIVSYWIMDDCWICLFVSRVAIVETRWKDLAGSLRTSQKISRCLCRLLMENQSHYPTSKPQWYLCVGFLWELARIFQVNLRFWSATCHSQWLRLGFCLSRCGYSSVSCFSLFHREPFWRRSRGKNVWIRWWYSQIPRPSCAGQSPKGVRSRLL